MNNITGIVILSYNPNTERCWWWCYPTPSEGCGGIPRRPNSRARDQKWKKQCLGARMTRKFGKLFVFFCTYLL